MKNLKKVLLLLALHLMAFSSFGQQANTVSREDDKMPTSTTGSIQISKTRPPGDENELKYYVMHDKANQVLNLKLTSKSQIGLTIMVGDEKGNYLPVKAGQSNNSFDLKVDITKLTGSHYFLSIFKPGSMSPFGYIPFN